MTPVMQDRVTKLKQGFQN